LTDNDHDGAEDLRARELRRTVVRRLATSPGRIQARLQLVARELQTFEINGLPEPWRVLRELLDDAALLTDEAAEELANRILDA
jgi:hypothetical protein